MFRNFTILLTAIVSGVFLSAPYSLAAEREVLRVSLYPWIPNSVSFEQWIEAEFEEKHPEVDLVVRPMKIARELNIDLSYDIGDTIKALTSERGKFVDQQDVVEIDTVILGALVEAGAISPFKSSREDFFEFSKKAVTLRGVTYGVPHWTCGYFIMSLHENVVAAKDAIELKSALESLGTEAPDLGGNIEGSWESVLVYLDAYLDTFPDADPQDILRHEVFHPKVAPFLEALGDACETESQFYCNRFGEMESEFAKRKLDALIGYSERLYFVLQTKGKEIGVDEIRITPAPLGGGKSAFMFTDALVLSSECTDGCAEAAKKFAEFYVSDEVLSLAMIGLSEAGEKPRYLLPATIGAMKQPIVSGDPIYAQIAPHMVTALPYPNTGLPLARATGKLRDLVNDELHN